MTIPANNFKTHKSFVMKHYTNFLLMITIAIVSCTHVYYSPNAANAPLLSEKGETRINALYSSGNISEFDGGELQYAQAINKNFGLMINGMAAGKSDNWTDYSGSSTSYHTEKGNGSYIEFAGGYFKNFDQKKKCIGEVYAGFGSGSVKNDYGDGNSKVNIFKYFIQPDIGYKSKYFEAAFVPKVSVINWKVKESNVTNSDIKADLNYIASRKSFVAFEPAILLRAGAKNVKFQFEMSFSNFNAASAFYSYDLIETLNSSIGISINLKPIKK